MSSPILEFFAYQHLPEKLQAVSKPIAELAEKMDAELPDGPEKSTGLRKLLEAKDCFVRQAVSKSNAPAKPKIKPEYVFQGNIAEDEIKCRVTNIDKNVVGVGDTQLNAVMHANRQLIDLGYEVIN